jgi:hypothetical protein
MKMTSLLWQIASVLVIVLIAGLAFMASVSGFEPVLLAALLIAFMSQMSCFTLVGFSEDVRLSTNLNNRKHLVLIVGGTAVSVMLILGIMLWNLITVTL